MRSRPSRRPRPRGRQTWMPILRARWPELLLYCATTIGVTTLVTASGCQAVDPAELPWRCGPGVSQTTFYQDEDGDGYGTDTTVLACTAPEGYTARPDDCDDRDPAQNPGALERCDGQDYNCNGTTGSAAILIYPDLDGDGFGILEGAQSGCELSEGWSRYADDCDDSDPARHPLLVDPMGLDAGADGTPTAPFRTIQQAVDQEQACGLVLLAPGTYLEPVEIVQREGLTLRGLEGLARTELHVTTGQRPMTLEGVSGLTLEGLTISGEGPIDGNGGCVAISDSSNVLLQDMVVQGCIRTERIARAAGCGLARARA